MSITAEGHRLDVGGNSGVVVSAYTQDKLGVELGCAVQPRDEGAWIAAIIEFPVKGGTPYLIEVSATGSIAEDGGAAIITARMR